MAGINTGILTNAYPLSSEAIKELEKNVLENNDTFAYLDENSELCFSMPWGVDGIKDLAWHNAYELSAEENNFTKKAYKKTGLKTFSLDKVLSKSNINDSWGEPERLEGDGQEFYTMAPSTLSFRSTAPLNELQDVQINGETVDPSNYELEEGSTIVKLRHDYLSTLDIGQYELSVVSESKTVKGDFTVAAPELNEYGFYYNQPYYIEDAYVGGGEGSNGSWGGDGGNTTVLSGAFIISTNNTVHVLNVEADTLSEVTFTCENNTYTFDFGGATLTGSFTSNGTSFVTSKVFISGGKFMPDYSGNDRVEFTLDTEAVCSDSEYLYYISSMYDCLVALPINDKKSSYNLPKVAIKDDAVAGFAHAAFSRNTDLNAVNFISAGFTQILTLTFNDCINITNVTIPSSIIHIGAQAFSGCTNLTSIIFEGTIAQWNAITKEDYWNQGVPATHVQCSDGQVAL